MYYLKGLIICTFSVVNSFVDTRKVVDVTLFLSWCNSICSFKELVASRPLSELRTPEEAAAVAEAGDEQIEGEVNPGSEPSKPVSASLKDAEELEKYIAIREEMYKKAKEFDSKIIGFETAIRRPYFHVRPLNVVELENWHNYLDFIEGGDDFNKVLGFGYFVDIEFLFIYIFSCLAIHLFTVKVISAASYAILAKPSDEASF